MRTSKKENNMEIEEWRHLKSQRREEKFSLHSWFMYSQTLFRSEDIQLEQSRHDTLQYGPCVCLSRPCDITVNLENVHGRGGSHFSSPARRHSSI